MVLDEIITPTVKQKLDALCLANHVRTPALFGSAVTDRFDSQRSDLAVLVEFHRSAISNMADTWEAMEDGLRAMFNRKVDMITADALENPYFRSSVLTHQRQIYPRR